MKQLIHERMFLSLPPSLPARGTVGGDFAPETEMTMFSNFSSRERWRKVQNLISSSSLGKVDE